MPIPEGVEAAGDARVVAALPEGPDEALSAEGAVTTDGAVTVRHTTAVFTEERDFSNIFFGVRAPGSGTTAPALTAAPRAASMDLL